MSERPEIIPITATVQQFMKLSGFGRTMVYKLIDDGAIQSVTIGRRRMIILESYRELLERRAATERTLNIISEKMAGNYKRASGGGCWIWIGRLDNGGYGVMSIEGENKYAHRISYELHNGPIPPGLFVCHHCDTPACINPKHLYAGTQADNMRDMAARGRGRKGRSRLPAAVRHEPPPTDGSIDGSEAEMGRKRLENIHG